MSFDEDSLFVKVLKQTKKTNVLESKALLQQAYENSQGIHDYIGQAIYEAGVNSEIDPVTKFRSNPDAVRPLSAVALHDAENACEGSALYQHIKLFADRKVFATYGMNLTEYLELPHDICEFIMSDCTKRMQKEINATEDVIQSLTMPKKIR